MRRRAAILVTCLVTLFLGCNFYLGDDDNDGKGHPWSHRPDGGIGEEVPDAGCGNPHGDADAGPYWPDGGTWSDAGFWPDASPEW